MSEENIVDCRINSGSFVLYKVSRRRMGIINERILCSTERILRLITIECILAKHAINDMFST